VIRRTAVYGFDETKIVIDVRALGITGFQASDFLRAHHRICVELQDTRRIMAVATLGDDSPIRRGPS
jgi:lysine decarboxylase